MNEQQIKRKAAKALGFEALLPKPRVHIKSQAHYDKDVDFFRLHLGVCVIPFFFGPGGRGDVRLWLAWRRGGRLDKRLEIPGGAWEDQDKTYWAGAARELWEEAGIRARRKDLIDLGPNVAMRPDGSVYAQRVFAMQLTKDRRPQDIETEKRSDWFAVELPWARRLTSEKLMPGLPLYFRRLQEYIDAETHLINGGVLP